MYVKNGMIDFSNNLRNDTKATFKVTFVDEKYMLELERLEKLKLRKEKLKKINKMDDN